MRGNVLLTRLPEQNRCFIALCYEHGDVDSVKRLNFYSKPLLTCEAIELGEDTKRHILGLDVFDYIIFISKNAVKFGLPRLQNYWPQWPQSLTWFAVGPGTAHHLRIEDLEVYSPSQSSSEGLLAMTELQAPVGKKVLIVRGVGGRETLKEGLQGRGASVDYAEVYRREIINYESADWVASGEKVFALVYSGEALIHLSRLLGILLTQYCLIVPSRRLQLMAIDEGFGKVELASSQQDSDMLESLLKCIEKQ
ncbi:MAG: uroporphyrinogen-III synthase [Flavobacterium sp.]|jgi:uroporphyrinogen-III synthase